MSRPEDGASEHPPLWVIVEGPDGAGKSSIARQMAHILCDAGGANRRACVLQKLKYDSRREQYVDDPTRWRYQGLHVVQDRGFLSEFVYNGIVRADPNKLIWMRELKEEGFIAGAQVVHVTAALHVLEARLEERGDDYLDPGQLKEVLEGYEGVMHDWLELGREITVIDTTWGFPSEMELTLELSILAAKAHL